MRVLKGLACRFAGWMVAMSVAAVASQAQDSDAVPAEPASGLSKILAQAELNAGDLSLDVAPDWLGHPASAAVPYVLPHWQRATRDPRQLIVLGANLLHAGRRFREQEPPSLMRLFTVFALQPRLAGFRGLPVPLAEPPSGEGALTAILAGLRHEKAHSDGLRAIDHQRWTATGVAASSLPPPGAEEQRLPETLRAPVARLLAALATAADAVERSWRNVPPAVLDQALGASDVPRLLAGGAVWWPALDDAARFGDDVERAWAALLVLAELERATSDLAAIDSAGLDGFDRWSVETSRGRVIVAGLGPHRHVCRGDCLAIIDLGGDDVYEGSAAAVDRGGRVSVVLDVDGGDHYRAGQQAAQGTGRGGVGMLFDLAGDDVYEAGDAAQGHSFLGYGLLWDADGQDRYRAGGGAQGSAVFGGGLLVDGGGRDEYRLLGEGQGFGGPGASGALVDLAGDDAYFAEPDAALNTLRADYHSEGRVAANNAQGAGTGRRGDQTDGHVWAGGVGVLADLAGRDTYTAGNFAQGMGYWFGTGMLLDGDGDDVYRSVYFSQASGAHHSLALLWDGGGDDRHLLTQEAAASLGYGWDFAASVFVDGGGNDLYQAANTAIGVAERSSLGLFFELGGDDVYRLPRRARALGAVRENFLARPQDGFLRAAMTAPQVGLFVDLGGEDTYPGRVSPCKNVPGNRLSWTCAPGREPPIVPRLGAGFDLEQPLPADFLDWLGLLASD